MAKLVQQGLSSSLLKGVQGKNKVNSKRPIYWEVKTRETFSSDLFNFEVILLIEDFLRFCRSMQPAGAFQGPGR